MRHFVHRNSAIDFLDGHVQTRRYGLDDNVVFNRPPRTYSRKVARPVKIGVD
jgi:hypothetical protein